MNLRLRAVISSAATYCLFAAVLIASADRVAPRNDPERARLREIFKPFVGTFVGHNGSGQENYATIEFDGKNLHFAKVGHVYSGNRLSIIPSTTRYRSRASGTMSGMNEVVASFENQPGELIFTEVRTAPRGRETEVHTFRLQDGILDHHFIRKYEKRRFVFWGPWVEDKTTFNAQHNARDTSESFGKSSDTPLSTRKLLKIESERPSTFVMQGSQADFELQRKLGRQQTGAHVKFSKKEQKRLEEIDLQTQTEAALNFRPRVETRPQSMTSVMTLERDDVEPERTREKAPPKEIKAPSSPFKAEKGNYLVIATDEHTVEVRMRHSGELVRTLKFDHEKVKTVSFTSNALVVETDLRNALYSPSTFDYKFSQSKFQAGCVVKNLEHDLTNRAPTAGR